MKKFLTREAATAVIVEEAGVPLERGSLKDLASRGRGPKFSIINGRALYTREDLFAWVQSEAAKPVQRRKRPDSMQGAA